MQRAWKRDDGLVARQAAHDKSGQDPINRPSIIFAAIHAQPLCVHRRREPYLFLSPPCILPYTLPKQSIAYPAEKAEYETAMKPF